MEQGKKKILIMGSTGMAGHVISLYLLERGFDITTFSRQRFRYCKNINGNALEESFIKSMLLDMQYDVVINCIGVLNQDCDKEPSKAIYLNSYLPHLIADTLRNTKTKLIHMSTDCVFSGKEGKYSEGSLRDGETFYDRTKAMGEVEDTKNLTFRNSIIGPDMNCDGVGLLNWFLKQQDTVKGYTKAIWTGVTTLTLAKAMEKAILEDLTGIYNLVNNDVISKYELLHLFNEYICTKKLKIVPSEEVNLNKSLVNNRSDFTFIVPSYKAMIIELRDWIYLHKDIYPHYF